MEAELIGSIARSLGRRGHAVREIVGRGSINRVFAVDDLAVRINHDRSSGEALKEYQKEQWCSAVVSSAIRVPQVLEVGERDGRAYIVTDFVSGPGGDEDPDRSWPILGSMLAAVHSIPAPGDSVQKEVFGESRSPREHWEWQREMNIESLGSADPLLGLGVYDEADLPWIVHSFAALRQAKFRFGLCHGDVTPRNLILSTEGEPALIDWGCASLEAVPAADLVQIWTLHVLRNEPATGLWNSFVAGYGSGAEEVLPFLPALSLLKSFDLVRWAIDRCPARVEELGARARALRGSKGG